jgi:hypothetical protein
MNPNQASLEVTQLKVLQAIGSSTIATQQLASTTQQQLASTTQAIYAIGYSQQLFAGIMILLMFGVIGYTFTKRYI